jgi:hypothetical protein
LDLPEEASSEEGAVEKYALPAYKKKWRTISWRKLPPDSYEELDREMIKRKGGLAITHKIKEDKMRDWRSRLGRKENGRDRMRVRSTGLWPPSKWLSPKPPVWVADQDLWMKVTKELDAAARGYEISRNEAAKIYRERGGAIKRSEPRLENRASRLRAERMQRLSAPKREPRFMEGGIVMGELDAIGSPEDIAHGLNITLEAAECIFEAIFKIPKARVEQAQKKYDKRMGEGEKGASRRFLRRRSQVSGLTYKVIKPLKADYFRWDLDTPAGTETLQPDFYLDVINDDVDGMVSAAQNLSHEGERYQPSSKHLYLIDPGKFEKCTQLVEN